MEQPDATPVASSATPESAPVDSSTVLERLSAPERLEWQKTGTLPEPKSETPPAESSPATPDDQAASTDAIAKPASEPAKPKKNADTRIQELLAERHARDQRIAELERRLATPPVDAQPAASSPAAAPTLLDTIQKPDLTKPMLNETEFFEAFPDAAYGSYSIYATKYLLAEDRQIAAQQAQEHQRQTQWRAKVAEFPDFDERIAALAALPSTPANAAISNALLDTANAKLAYHLATHVDEAKRLQDLPPHVALLELGKLDATLNAPASAPAAPAPKTVTDAPTPPHTLGPRPADPGDPVKNAVIRGDVRAYIAEANRLEMATTRK